jgi:iron complex transport system permease protein
LGSAGAEMQTILNNPLASPYTLGVSSAAGFGAALVLVLGIALVPFGKQFLIATNAFIFALGSSLAVYVIAGTKKGTTEIIILAGIALLFLFYSLTALLEYLATEEQLQAVVFWLFGSLNKTTWTKLLIVTAVFAAVFPLLLSRAWKLTTLRLGETVAESMGINVKKLRLTTLVLVSLLTATAVCFVGTIGFIGIVAPHIARFLGGEDQRFFLPLSALVGASLLSGASVASKLIMPGAVFPIGIVTSFIGIPFFLSLILSKRKSYW